MSSSDAARTPGRLARFLDSDLWWSFRNHKAAVVAAIVFLVLVVSAFTAPLYAPQNPFDPAQLELINAEIPPIWTEQGQWPFILGTDTQGRDILSAILYGSRSSILIGIGAVVLSLIVGIGLGLIAGYYGGFVDNALMRIGDILLSMPTMLIAILISAIVRQMLPPSLREIGAAGVLIFAIVLVDWVQYARTVRAQTTVERGKEYVQAARLLRVSPRRIMMHHILPNTLTPISVAATLNFSMAIMTEATLSFLGIGMPASQPSLGTLIRLGNEFLFAGIWWVVIFPVAQLCILVVSVNVLGDWLRDALNPKLR